MAEEMYLYRFIVSGVIFIFCCIAFYIYLKVSQKLKIKRAVREETGERHLAKQHIPDMAGIVMIAIFMSFSLINGGFFNRPELVMFIILMGLLGFADDIVKSRAKDTKGIPARYRIILQSIIAVAFIVYSLYMYLCLNYEINLLFAINALIVTLVFLLATVNAANFSDGLDGLLAGMATINIFGFFVFWQYYSWAAGILYTPAGYDITILQLFIPIILAFMIFNKHPAKMFMGDGGSMFIGAFLAVYAVENRFMLAFLIMAFPMYFELISVVFQVISFRLTRKRVFPMTPFHHSFEKWGWSEPKIVWFYYIITIIFTACGVWYAVWKLSSSVPSLMKY